MICEQCKKLAEFDFAISTLKRLHGEASDCSGPFCDGDAINEYYLQLNKRFKEKKEIRVTI